MAARTLAELYGISKLAARRLLQHFIRDLDIAIIKPTAEQYRWTRITSPHPLAINISPRSYEDTKTVCALASSKFAANAITSSSCRRTSPPPASVNPSMANADLFRIDGSDNVNAACPQVYRIQSFKPSPGSSSLKIVQLRTTPQSCHHRRNLRPIVPPQQIQRTSPHSPATHPYQTMIVRNASTVRPIQHRIQESCPSWQNPTPLANEPRTLNSKSYASS